MEETRIFLLITIIFIVAFLWAAFSARKELSTPHEIKRAKKDLHREKILFKR